MTALLKRKACKAPEAKTREAILRAAIQEFAAHGFAGARTEQIAKTAKVNKAMLHYYYHDKETLYEAVLDSIFNPFSIADRLIDELTRAPLNSVQHIRIFMKVIITKNSDPKQKAFRAILAWELAGGQNNYKRVAQKYLVPRMVPLIQLIERGIHKKELECNNPTLAVYSIISQVVFYYMHRETYRDTELYADLYGNVTPESLLEILLQNFVAAYAIEQKIETKLPAEYEKLANELASTMAANPFLQE